MVQLALTLEFDDATKRSIYSQLPVEFLEKLKVERAFSFMELDRYPSTGPPIEYLDYVMYESPFEDKLRKLAEHLAHELVDNGLINPKDLGQIADLFFKTIEESLAAVHAATTATTTINTPSRTTAPTGAGAAIVPSPPPTTSPSDNATSLSPVTRFYLSPTASRDCLLDDIFV